MLALSVQWVILHFTLSLNQGENPETWQDGQIILKYVYNTLYI